jgi:hypothetical protein
MTHRVLWVICALWLAACSCKQNEPITAQEIAGRVVLESYELDLTWGYRLRGMYIVGDGTVWSYQYEGPPFYPEKLKPGELGARDMLTKHRNATKIGSVDRKALLDMAQMIRPAAAGKIVRAVPTMQGASRLDVAYDSDPESGTYTEIVLSGTGDRAASNSAPAAATLVDYLNDVQGAVGWTW